MLHAHVCGTRDLKTEKAGRRSGLRYGGLQKPYRRDSEFRRDSRQDKLSSGGNPAGMSTIPPGFPPAENVVPPGQIDLTGTENVPAGRYFWVGATGFPLTYAGTGPLLKSPLSYSLYVPLTHWVLQSTNNENTWAIMREAVR